MIDGAKRAEPSGDRRNLFIPTSVHGGKDGKCVLSDSTLVEVL
jgi:hypothetical protein